MQAEGGEETGLGISGLSWCPGVGGDFEGGLCQFPDFGVISVYMP